MSAPQARVLLAALAVALSGPLAARDTPEASVAADAVDTPPADDSATTPVEPVLESPATDLPAVEPAPVAATVAPPSADSAPVPSPPATRSGREIYRRFREGLSQPECGDSSPRWRAHFATAPRRLAESGDEVLPLFGYVVDALREAHLPTEYALIPFVESGYRPGARSPSGPAGLWQFIAVTARNHQVPMRGGYDGRLSPVDSTRAAVRYLKTLHGMFAGDWRLAVMAYNAGEYRILGALRRSGQNARNARPDALPGLSGITYAYVQKLRALSCLMVQADARADWLDSLDREVPILEAQAADAPTLRAWGQARGLDAAALARLNPALAQGRIVRDPAVRVLAPRVSAAGMAVAVGASPPANAAVTAPGDEAPVAAPRTTARAHTVSRGDSAWAIARRYGIATAELLRRNGLDKRARLRPGMVLRIDAGPDE